ncbi:hypothetical protein F5141DRAFT_1216142 [Pisolithus sp. B1]|nr:hypothetical protein F5141DRAFT_1216142 [Pisolithus sp. B1]
MQIALLLVSVTLAAVGGVKGLVAVDRRQNPLNVPAACSSTCQPVVDETNLGCPESQCCTNTFITEYYNCFACIGSNTPSFDYAAEQTALNELWQACETAGYSLSPPSALPGQTAPTGNVDASTPGKTTAKAASATTKSLATFSTITAPAAAPAPTTASTSPATVTTVSGNATSTVTSGVQSTPTNGAAREAQVHIREDLGADSYLPFPPIAVIGMPGHKSA